jgi:hypothetical protein
MKPPITDEVRACRQRIAELLRQRAPDWAADLPKRAERARSPAKQEKPNHEAPSR